MNTNRSNYRGLIKLFLFLPMILMAGDNSYAYIAAALAVGLSSIAAGIHWFKN